MTIWHHNEMEIGQFGTETMFLNNNCQVNVEISGQVGVVFKGKKLVKIFTNCFGSRGNRFDYL